MLQELEIEKKEKKRLKYRGFLKEVRDELKKVSWTSRKELILSTKIVIGATFLFGIGIYFSDMVIKETLNSMNSIVQKVIG